MLLGFRYVLIMIDLGLSGSRLKDFSRLVLLVGLCWISLNVIGLGDWNVSICDVIW